MSLATMFKEFLAVIGSDDNECVFSEAQPVHLGHKLPNELIGAGDLTVIKGNKVIQITFCHGRMDIGAAGEVHASDYPAVVRVEFSVKWWWWCKVVMNIPHMHKQKEGFSALLLEPIGA